MQEYSLSQPFLRRIRLQMQPLAAFGLVGVRFYTENQNLAPTIGVGLSPWIIPQWYDLDWQQFTRLDGPPYKIQIETYNTYTSAVNLLVFFETDHFNYIPVNQMQISKNYNGQLKADPSKQENAG